MKYEMNLIVPVRLVGPIMELLDGEGVLVSTKPHDETMATGNKKVFRYAGGKKNKGISSEELIKQMLADGSKTDKEMSFAFKRHGFADTSTAASLSHYRIKGLVRRDANNKWELV
jgi:hypothetical protein